MSDLSKIYDALMAAKHSNESLATWVTRADAHDEVRAIRRAIDEGFDAYRRLQTDLRDGRKHVEPPDEFKHTSCYCSAPTCSPPCGWCTDPANNDNDTEDWPP